MATTIETGVDRLVSLIQAKEKISLVAAAKELGVSKLVITEWAEFLADEKLIQIEYSLSKTYLIAQEITDSTVEDKAANFEAHKETFVRQVDTSNEQLNRSAAGFDSIKREFAVLKKTIGDEIKDVRHEIDELNKFEKLKSDIDADIEKELTSYREQIHQAAISIDHEKKRYETLLDEITQEQKTIASEKKYLQSLEELEQKFEKKAKEITDFVADAKEQIKKGANEVKVSEKHLDKLTNEAKKLKDKLDTVKKKKIDPLSSQQQEHDSEIKRLQTIIKEKAASAKKQISADSSEAKAAAKKFDVFFEKKMNAEKELAAVAKQQEQLQAEYEKLKKAAISFSVAGKKSTKKHLHELEKKYEELEKKRASYTKKLESFVRGMFH